MNRDGQPRRSLSLWKRTGVRASVPQRLCVAVIAAVCGLLSTASLLRADDVLEQRRARIAEMDSTAKERLLQREERFLALAPAEQERLRRLHEQLDNDADAEALRSVMQQYYQWLKTLPSVQREELQSLPPQKRVEAIKRIKQEQARKEAKRANPVDAARIAKIQQLMQEQGRKGGKRATPQDVEALIRWMLSYASRRGPKAVDELPPAQRQEAQQELGKAADPAARRQALVLIWLRAVLGEQGKRPPITSVELADLRSRLTPPTQQRLASFSEDEQWKAVTAWARVLVNHRLVELRPGQPALSVSDEELAEFLEQKVTPEQRNRLLGLPADEMQRELSVLYWRAKLPDIPGLAANAGRNPSRPGSKKGETTSDKGGKARGKGELTPKANEKRDKKAPPPDKPHPAVAPANAT